MPISEVLEGAFDLHVHTAPDCQERKQSADEFVQDLLRYRLGGALLKDHTTNTADRAQILRERYPQLGLFGAVIEHSFVVCTALNRQPLSIAEVTAQILAVGPEHCTLSTDLGQVLNPPPVEGFTTFVEGLLKEGVSVSQLRRMVVDNPRMLLGV